MNERTRGAALAGFILGIILWSWMYPPDTTEPATLVAPFITTTTVTTAFVSDIIVVDIIDAISITAPPTTVPTFSVCADLNRGLIFSDIYDSRLHELGTADSSVLWNSMGNDVLTLCRHNQDRLPTEFLLPDECDTPCD